MLGQSITFSLKLIPNYSSLTVSDINLCFPAYWMYNDTTDTNHTISLSYTSSTGTLTLTSSGNSTNTSASITFFTLY